ncbi:hypothetical protein BH10PSE19_BH10PSE19_18030 [soil metagenome]
MGEYFSGQRNYAEERYRLSSVPLYITELVPAPVRGKCVTFFQLFLAFGIVLAYLVDLAFTPSGNWRAMFAVVIIPAIILMIAVFWLPESPRWLILKKRPEKAFEALLQTRNQEVATQEIKAIYQALEKEVQISWRELLLSRQFLMPLMIAVLVAIFNQMTGINSFLQYAPQILKSTGFSSDLTAMLGSLGIGVLNFICTLIAMLLVDTVGRKPLLIFGTAGIVLAEVYLAIINQIGLPPHMQGVLSLIGLFCFIISYALGPGVVVWLVISELFPTRFRGRGISICLFFNSLASTILASVFLVLKDAIGFGGTYWICAGFSFFYMLTAIFLVPETKSRTLEEIQHSFDR